MSVSDYAILKYFQDQVQLQHVEGNFDTVDIWITWKQDLYLTQKTVRSAATF